MEHPRKKKNKNPPHRFLQRKTSGSMTSSSNIFFLPFGKIHCSTLLRPTALYLKTPRKTSSSTPKSFRSLCLFAPFSSRASLKKRELQSKFWKNVSSKDSSRKKIKRSSHKFLFATISKCLRESWSLKTNNLKSKLWKKSENKVLSFANLS